MTRRCSVVALIASAALALAACGGDPSGPQLEGIDFGYAVESADLVAGSSVVDIVERDATIVTTENDMKWSRLRPSADEFDFVRSDSIVLAAQSNGQQVRGHPLVWHRQLPDWLVEGEWTRDELIDVLRQHISTVVTRYRVNFPGVVTQWDVVNEAFTSTGERRDTIWQRVIGDDYIRLAFEFAHAADPDALLFYNDYYDDSLVSGGDPDLRRLGASPERSDCDDVPKCASTQELVKQFVDDGVPIDGVGFEAHVFDLQPPDYRKLASWTAGLDLQWAITELDVALEADKGSDADTLTRQAEVYAEIVGACIGAANCNTVVVWGVDDSVSWIPGETNGELDHALLYRADGSEKPATRRVLDAVAAARSGS